LCIIWAAFLLPSRRRDASPISTVEDFERKMSMLAEANKGPRGRWVVMPGKGERLMGARERNRLRVRRRRRVVLTALAELAVLSLIIGLIPPLRPILYASGVFAGLFVLYALLLLKVRSDEARRARARRLRMARRRIAMEHSPEARGAPLERRAFAGDGYGASSPASTARPMDGAGVDRGYGERHTRNGRNGHEQAGVRARPPVELDDDVFGPGSQIIDGDVHVVIRRASEIEAQLQAAGQ
jgi:hypothetical protein